MGAYGAMNIGTKHSDLFGTIAALGGPVDMRQLLRDMVNDNLEMKSQTIIPLNVGDDFTFDHQAPYPGRDTRLSMIKDLIIAFGNPFLHHPDASQQYLAMDSEPARLLRDDVFGTFLLSANPRGFLDGGDANQDGVRQTTETPNDPVDVLLVAGGSLPRIASGATGVDVGGRMLADVNGDGIYDVGDGIVVNLSEPFTDTNGNLVFEPELGETFSDVGLDGVAGTGDYGEGNGGFDYDPDRANWLAEDPLTRLEGRSAADIGTQRIYMDVGTEDEFGFGKHYDNFIAMLQSKGLTVDSRDDFPANCVDIAKLPQQYLLIRYAGGHVGIPEADDSQDKLLHGDICGTVVIWQRLLAMISYMDSSFPNGFDGPGDLEHHRSRSAWRHHEDTRHLARAARRERARTGTAGAHLSAAGIFSHQAQLPDRVHPRRVRTGAGRLRTPRRHARSADSHDADAEHVRCRPARRRRPQGVVLRESPRPGIAGARSDQPDVGALRGLDHPGPDPDDREYHPEGTRAGMSLNPLLWIRTMGAWRSRIPGGANEFPLSIR